jgi:hypothetical protein
MAKKYEVSSKTIQQMLDSANVKKESFKLKRSIYNRYHLHVRLRLLPNICWQAVPATYKHKTCLKLSLFLQAAGAANRRSW